MSQLLLIRHGQASFGAADYDRLSAIGERQARLVGRHLARLGQTFDVLVAGDMQRQIRTAELASEAWVSPPPLALDPAFNEYDVDAMFTAHLPGVLEANPALAERRDELLHDRRLFQKAFEAVTRAWIADAARASDAGERWAAFSARVRAGLSRLRDHHPRDARIGVFTSGGPIAVAVAEATGSDAGKTIELNWALYNAQISELRATRDGWRLTAFNDISALRAAGDPALVTFR